MHGVSICVCSTVHVVSTYYAFLGLVYTYPDIRTLVKRILLKTFTQTIYTKTPKTYSECGYFVNGYLSGYSINAFIDRFRVNKLYTH